MNNELTARQEAKFNMYRATETHIADNATIIAANPAFQTAFNKFKTNNVAISGTAQQKSGALTGIAVDKTNFRETLCQTAAKIAGYIYAYASANNNNTLKNEMNLPVTKIRRARDEELAPRCQNIHDRGVELLTELADFGVTAPILANLQTAITNYAAEIPKPRTALSGRKTVTANLAAIFRENDDILKNQMDKLIEIFREDNPDFVQTYESNRIIIDPSTTTTQLKGIVTNVADNSPVKNATITIVEASKSAKTNTTGKYSIKPLAPGKYTVRTDAAGFNDFEVEGLSVKLGTINVLNVKLTGN